MVLSKPSITITDRHWASRKQIVKTIKKTVKSDIFYKKVVLDRNYVGITRISLCKLGRLARKAFRLWQV